MLFSGQIDRRDTRLNHIVPCFVQFNIFSLDRVLALLIALIKGDRYIVRIFDDRRIGVQPEPFAAFFDLRAQAFGKRSKLVCRSLRVVVNARVDLRLILAEILDDMLIVRERVRRVRHMTVGGHTQGLALQAEGAAQKLHMSCIEYF